MNRHVTCDMTVIGLESGKRTGRVILRYISMAYLSYGIYNV